MRAGYNHQLSNNVVLGVEADVWLGSVENDWRDSNQFSGYFTEDKVTSGASLRARLGYAMDRFMPFVTGGVAIANTKNTLGALTDKWTLSAEYLYTDLGKNKVTLIDPGFVAATINARHFDTQFSTIRLGVNYKF